MGAQHIWGLSLHFGCTLFLAVAIGSLSSASLGGDMYQECTGRMGFDDFGYHLFGDFAADTSGNSTWCDASLSEQNKELVLKVCPLGTRCEISGEFAGHGTFEWTIIHSVIPIWSSGINTDKPANWGASCELAKIYVQSGKIEPATDLFMSVFSDHYKDVNNMPEICFPAVRHSMQWAAEGGDLYAYYWLGRLAEGGVGQPKDPIRALQLYIRAANRGILDVDQRIIALEDRVKISRTAELCALRAKCEELGKIQQQCAAAGSVKQCTNIKYAGKPVPTQCADDGSGRTTNAEAAALDGLQCIGNFVENAINGLQ